QMPLIAVGEVRGVDEAERRGREQFALLALARRGFDQLGGVPFAEIDLDALRFEPAFEQVNLRGLARAVETFDGDEASGKSKLGESFHVAWGKPSRERAARKLFPRNDDAQPSAAVCRAP